MDLTGKIIRRASGTVLTATALAAAGSYLMTHYLLRVAIDRDAPKLMSRLGERISGTLLDRTILQRLDTAAKELASEEMKTVTITGNDGVALVGHWYPCQNPKRIVIAMHGWRSCWNWDFGIVAPFWHKSGCSVLFAEQRGQNNSGGSFIGFGMAECYDCREWVRWATEVCDADLPIYLGGVSMGATTVLLAAGLHLPSNVRGIVADCGFTSPRDIWRHVAKHNLHISFRFRSAAVESLFERKTHVSASGYSTADALARTEIPVLLVHGTEDHFVPVEMTYENYKACVSPKRLLIVPGADHGMSYLVDRHRYEAAIRSFWEEFDSKPPAFKNSSAY